MVANRSSPRSLFETCAREGKNNGTTEQSDVTEVSEAHLALDDAGGTALEEMEKQMIREALSRHSSKKQVADELGIGIATLYRKIKKYELLNA